MKESSVSDQTKSRFAEVAQNFSPTVASKWQKLLALKSGIAQLRQKRASYRIIVDILRDLDVSVSLPTVSRFCREVIEKKPSPLKKQQSMSKALSSISHKLPNGSILGKQPSQGPSIADPNTI